MHHINHIVPVRPREYVRLRAVTGGLLRYGTSLTPPFRATTASAAPALLIRQSPVRFSTNPFTLGVASGYSLANGVALWTRLAPALLRKTLKSMLQRT